MDGPGGELFRSKPLADVTVMQSIAFDTWNQRLFTGQLRSKTGANSGDLTLTQLTMSGDVVGHMYLSGFGHAVSIGAETVGRTTYLWTETDVDTANGRGRQIARFRWQDGATLTKDSQACGSGSRSRTAPCSRPRWTSGTAGSGSATRWRTAFTSTCTRWRRARAGNFFESCCLVQSNRR